MKKRLPTFRNKPPCFSAWDWFFSVTATKGWAWCNHNAELVERTVALGNLLLVGSGCLEIRIGKAGIASFNKHVQQISFRQLENIGSWKAGSPASNPRRLKACSSHIRARSVSCNKSWTPQLRDQTLCFFAWDWFFSAAATQGWEWSNHNAGLEWRLRFHKRHGFLWQTCMKNLLSAVHHALRTWAAERLEKPHFSAWDWFFSAAARKGWAWCKQNAELVERTAALSNLKLLVGSGCLEIRMGKVGIGS